MNNIPEGFDENGVRNGNGVWEDDEENTEIDIDQFEPVIEEDMGECIRCGELLPKDSMRSVSYGTGYICEVCADDMG